VRTTSFPIRFSLLWLFYRSDFKIGICRSWGCDMDIRIRRCHEKRLSGSGSSGVTRRLQLPCICNHIPRFYLYLLPRLCNRSVHFPIGSGQRSTGLGRALCIERSFFGVRAWRCLTGLLGKKLALML